MAQHDYVIDNQSFPATRSDLNSLFQAIASNNSGSSAPSTTYANQFWYDTTNNKFYIRNEDNDAWIELFVLDQTGDHLEKIGNTITLDNAGNVGIGTTPAQNLHIVDAGGTRAVMELQTGASNQGFVQYVHSGQRVSIGLSAADDNTGSNGGSIFNVTSSGDCGINTTSPSSSISGSSTVLQINDSNVASIALNNTGASTKFEVASVASDALIFSDNGTERMRIDGSSGNVGIGTTSPNGKLHVTDQTDIVMSNSADGQITIEGNGYSGAIALSSVGMQIYQNSGARSIIFGNDEIEMMRIRNDGGVGIGTVGASTVRLFVSEGSNSYGVYNYATNAAYTNDVYLGQCGRSASSSYNLLTLFAQSDREFQFRGDGNAFADGSFSGGGADYAEMFEWDDGNSSNEDRRGYSVVLTNGNKIRKATSDDAAADIIGVVSANPTVLGDSAWNVWNEKYNKDDFGGFVMETYTITEWTEPAVFEDVEIEAVLDEEGNETEPARTEQRKISDEVEHSYETDKIPSDLTVPSDAVVSSVDADGNTLKRRQLNSNYDDTQTYTPREERQEWDAVGMMGKLRMRSGQPTGDRWIKMRDITSDVEEWLVR